MEWITKSNVTEREGERERKKRCALFMGHSQERVKCKVKTRNLLQESFVEHWSSWKKIEKEEKKNTLSLFGPRFRPGDSNHSIQILTYALHDIYRFI